MINLKRSEALLPLLDHIPEEELYLDAYSKAFYMQSRYLLTGLRNFQKAIENARNQNQRKEIRKNLIRQLEKLETMLVQFQSIEIIFPKKREEKVKQLLTRLQSLIPRINSLNYIDKDDIAKIYDVVDFFKTSHKRKLSQVGSDLNEETKHASDQISTSEFKVKAEEVKVPSELAGRFQAAEAGFNSTQEVRSGIDHGHSLLYSHSTLKPDNELFKALAENNLVDFKKILSTTPDVSTKNELCPAATTLLDNTPR